MKTIHSADMVARGGRDGTVCTPDELFTIELSSLDRPNSITPEHLMAGAYAASFLAALQSAAASSEIVLGNIRVVGHCSLDEDDVASGSTLKIDLRATLPGVDEKVGRHLLNLAHQTCPYSKATRGNIEVTLGLE